MSGMIAFITFLASSSVIAGQAPRKMTLLPKEWTMRHFFYGACTFRNCSCGSRWKMLSVPFPFNPFSTPVIIFT
jgi:hypothetical protein